MYQAKKYNIENETNFILSNIFLSIRYVFVIDKNCIPVAYENIEWKKDHHAQ